MNQSKISKFGDKDSIQNGIRVPIGYYRHNGPDPIVEKKQNYETASYYKKIEAPAGVYPIYPGWDHYGRHGGQATLYVEFDGVVTDDYFPTSLGGVPIGDTKPKYIGEEEKFSFGLDPTKAVCQTGNSTHKDKNKDGQIPPDIYINPKYWADIESYYSELLKKDTAHLEQSLKNLEEHKSNPDKTMGAIGMLRYSSNCVSGVCHNLEKIHEMTGYLKTPTFSKLHTQNTRWVPKTLDEAKKPKKGKTEDTPTIG